jgi:hypothetical protein
MSRGSGDGIGFSRRANVIKASRGRGDGIGFSRRASVIKASLGRGFISGRGNGSINRILERKGTKRGLNARIL